MMIQSAYENRDFLIHVDFADSISTAPTMCRALYSVEESSRDTTSFLSLGNSQANGGDFTQI